MLDWIRSLFAKPPPLPKPWPKLDDVVREVVISLTDQPAKWRYSPPYHTWSDGGGSFCPSLLTHAGGTVAVAPSGSVFIRSRHVAADDTIAALFWQHPAVVAAKEKAAEASARPLADAIRSLRS